MCRRFFRLQFVQLNHPLPQMVLTRLPQSIHCFCRRRFPQTLLCSFPAKDFRIARASRRENRRRAFSRFPANLRALPGGMIIYFFPAFLLNGNLSIESSKSYSFCKSSLLKTLSVISIEFSFPRAEGY